MKVTTHQALGFLFFFGCNANMDNLATHSLELLSDGPPETSSSGSEHSISTALPDQRATDRAKILSHPGTSSSPARSTDNPPVIDLTLEIPHLAEMKDRLGEASTKAPGMNAGSRRKISGDPGKRDERTELATTQNSQPSELQVRFDVEGRPPKMIKLMGAFMGTEVRPDRIDSDGTIKQSDSSNQGHHVPDSTEASKTADRGKQIAQTLIITDASSSNLERIPARIITLESTGSALKDLIIDVERQSQNTQTSRTKDEPRRLKFTEDVLDFSNTPAEYQSHFLDALGDVLLDLKAKELVMTEAQFIIYHTDFYRIYQRSELAPHSDSKTNIPYSKKSQAYKHMLEHKDKWYSHWQTLMTQINLENSTDKLHLKSKELVLPYLFYVEMISTIVPISTTKQNDLGIHLKQAWDLLESIFGKETVADKQGKGKIYEKFSNYDRFNSLGLSSKVSALWDLLELWLDTHRPTLSDEIRAFGRTFHTIKAFFNSLFFLSVENLTQKFAQIE
ncbi:hypothetical protein PGTUg99_037420 [Puccinia graminis f. sp. tritici]|uniref:Uncharacterized protein n=1 Tax=Puccinia graminis f. sp. tritici TaxID=56615 RepID=A0A5B0RSC6_PUCGR|nr:hypothetical protein PGTUg99_037420 [Puccinia graminis f. sp. tritici]